MNTVLRPGMLGAQLIRSRADGAAQARLIRFMRLRGFGRDTHYEE